MLLTSFLVVSIGLLYLYYVKFNQLNLLYSFCEQHIAEIFIDIQLTS